MRQRLTQPRSRPQSGRRGHGHDSRLPIGRSFNRLGKYLAISTAGAIATIVIGTFLLQPLGVEGRTQDAANRIWWIAKHPSLEVRPTCKDTGYYHRRSPDNADAIDYYHQSRDDEYIYTNTYDGKRQTAWVEYGWGTHGKNGDTISWDFPRKENIKLLCVTNGLAKNIQAYRDTGTIKTVQIRGCGATPRMQDLKEFTDTSSDAWENPQEIDMSCTTDKLIFDIAAIYPAQDRSNVDEVGISEVTFWG
ncbi:hypothetical protein [Allobranchiibius sp. GilTou38]|uniref:NADase-type glycan-binding domain-containing protein n=1 Tax=Allobranchiibius sp. GilTou38 TaxID=2815210 RepID=UPI001AA0D921|nr:hypothetical protein [Allobranchiibius sp. GilTou38]MBO1767420.1 hypothetical protein [Allobranchiibius sp. GilTou38]